MYKFYDILVYCDTDLITTFGTYNTLEEAKEALVEKLVNMSLDEDQYEHNEEDSYHINFFPKENYSEIHAPWGHTAVIQPRLVDFLHWRAEPKKAE